MPKNFKSLPERLKKQLHLIDGNAVEVRCLKKMSSDDLRSLTWWNPPTDPIAVGDQWAIIPLEKSGKAAARNAIGWTIVRKDLPKYTKTFCHEIEHFGDGSKYGWSTVCNDRDVYHRDVYPASLHEVLISVDEELSDTLFGVSFSISDQFDKDDGGFESDILLAVNLLQEQLGDAELVHPSKPRQYYSETLDWQLFPPDGVAAVITSLISSGRLKRPDELETAKARLSLFERFSPENYLRGLAGNDTYVGAKFADDLVVFESVKYGNALYFLYVDWKEQSKQPRSRLLKLSGNKIDRIVHRGNWEDEFVELLRSKLKERGLKLRRK